MEAENLTIKKPLAKLLALALQLCGMAALVEGTMPDGAVSDHD